MKSPGVVGMTDDEKADLARLPEGSAAYELRLWEIRVRMRRARLTRLIELDAPEVIIENERDLVEQAEAQVRRRTS